MNEQENRKSLTCGRSGRKTLGKSGGEKIWICKCLILERVCKKTKRVDFDVSKPWSVWSKQPTGTKATDGAGKDHHSGPVASPSGIRVRLRLPGRCTGVACVDESLAIAHTALSGFKFRKLQFSYEKIEALSSINSGKDRKSDLCKPMEYSICQCRRSSSILSLTGIVLEGKQNLWLNSLMKIGI